MRLLLRRKDGLEQWIATKADLKAFKTSGKLFVVAMQDADGQELRQDKPSKQPEFKPGFSDKTTFFC